MPEFDLIVIGGGSGGVRAARIAASHGASVAICESYRYGGTCVIRGCVPKKLMVYASHFHEDFSDSTAYGWNHTKPEFNWRTLIDNKDKEIDRLNGIYENLLKNAGVHVFNGEASFIDENTICVGDENLRGKNILIATGGIPFVPDFSGQEHVITSNEVFHLEQQPRSILVVGGGYIAVEFAGIFNGLGSETTLLYRSEQILRGFDDSIRGHLANKMTEKGITLTLNNNVASIELNAKNQRIVHLQNGEQLTVDCVLYATGRIPNTQALQLDKTAVATGKKGEIIVDKHSCTNVGHIYAVGDVTDRIALTPVATMEGHAFADTVFGNKPRLADHDNVPSAVFSQPPIASVGLSEQDAKKRYTNIDVYQSEFKTLKHSITKNTERTLIKVIVDQASDKVIGAHMIGSDAAEIMQGIAIAVKAGATKADFDATVGIHPSSAEEFCTLRTKL